VTFARQRGKSFRIVGTYDNEDRLLYSQGQKNFRDKKECTFCHQKKPMVYRFAIALKGEPIVFGDDLYCSVSCFHKRDQSPLTQPQQ
jgi:hypothetical protein